MAKLTIEEKAARYDALQKELNIIIEQYESMKKDAESRSELTVVRKEPSFTGFYNKGRMDAYIEAIRTLKDFAN